MAEFVQDGNDLILKLKNGKTMVIVNFFVEHDDETSDVLFKDDAGIPWLPIGLGGLGIAGGLALASDGGSDNNGGSAPNVKNHIPETSKPFQPIETMEDQSKKGQITDVTDKDNDKLTYQLGDQPKNGTVTVDEKTGEYTYTPNQGVTGDDSFTVVVSDGKGGEVTVTVPVTVTPVNDAPTADESQPLETKEDNSKSGTIVAEDKDGDELTYKVGEEPKNGQVVVDEKTGKYTYKPNPDYHGDDKFTVVVSDGKGGEVTVTVPVTVTPVNDAPTADESQPLETKEDNSKSGTIVAEDKDGDELTYKVGDKPTHGTVTVDEKTGKYTYTPNPDYHGDDKFTVVVSDGKGGEVTVTVPVTVTPVNDAPTADESQPLETKEDNSKSGTIVAEDKDGDELTYKVGDKPTHGTVTVDEKTGKYTYKPNPDYHGDDKFTVVVSDGKGGEVTVTVPVTVTPVNDAPTADESQPLETKEDNSKSGTIVAEDKDGDELTYKVGDKPTHGTVTVDEKTGKYTYTPNPDYHGDDKFTVVVSDGKGGEVTVTVPVTVTPVNDAPTADESQPLETKEDNSKSGTIVAEDKDGDELTYKVGDKPTHGTVTVDEKTGKYTYKPNPDYHGDDKFTVVVSDGKGGEVTVTVPVTVTPVNDAPTADESQPLETKEDNSKSGTIVAEDKDGDELTYKVGDKPTHGTVTVDEKTGKYTYTPNPDYHGDDKFTVVVSDGKGGEVTVTVPVTVTPVNDAPTADESQPLETKEDNSKSGTIVAEDKDGDELTYKVGDKPTHGTVTVDEKTGKYTYKPNPDYHGDDKFTVVVSDGKGGEVTVTVPVTVTPVNDAPTADESQPLETKEDNSKSGTIVAEDKDGDELTYKVGDKPTHGTVTVDEKTGKYTYTPNPDYHGDDKFTVVVSDGKGGEVTVTVPVTVTPVNDAPTADESQPLETKEDNSKSGTIVAEDKDGDELTYKVGDKPTHGTVTVDEKTGKYTYKPNPDYHGDDKFTVVVSDGKGGEVTVTVPVTVTPVNDAPTADESQPLETKEDNSKSGTIVAEDKDGDELTYKVGDKPTHGTVTVDEKTGKYTYTPNPDYHGDDKFTVVVSDGKGGEVTVTVPVTVTPVNDAPTADESQPLETKEDNSKSGTIVAEDKDGDELTYKVGDKPTHGTVTVDEKTGKYTYKPNPDYHGDDKFTVVVSDGKGGEVTVTVPVTVTPVNDAPTADESQPLETKEDNSKSGTIVAEDKDGDELTYKVGDKPTHGTVTVDEKTGKYTYTPNPDYHGDDKFTVVVSDGKGGEVTVTVPVTVTPVNDAPTADESQPLETKEDNSKSGTIVAEDKDGDELTYKVGDKPTHGTVTVDEKTGKYTYKPNPDYHGDDKFTVVVSDGKGGEVTVTVPVTVTPVNDAPTADESQPLETKEDNSKSGTIVAEDKDGDELTYKVGDKPTHGTVTVDEKTGKYTYTPNPDYHGDDKFTVVVSDGKGGEVTVTVPVTVTPVNDAPTADESQPLETKEDNSKSGTIVAEDKDGDELTYKVGDKPTHGTVTVDEKTGKYTYKPNPDYHGDDKFTVVVSDGKGGEVTVTVPVTVTPVNDAPTADESQPLETKEDNSKSGTIVAEDKDGDELTYKVGDKPTHGTVTVDEKTGKYTYTPNPDYHGDDKFTVVVSDGKGGEVTVTVPVTVTPVNDAPTADESQPLETKEDNSKSGTIVAEDKDGDELTYKVGDKPTHGTVTVDEKTGKYTYKPNPDYHGDDKFTVVVSDGKGGEVTVTVPVTVTPVNDAPTADESQPLETKEDNSKSGTIVAEDKDGDELTYKVGDKPTHGTVTVDEKTGKYTYKPNPDYHGDDKFTVVVSDGKGGEVTVTVPVTVTPVNDAPTADESQPLETKEDNSKSGTIVAEDKDGDELTYKVGDKPTHGTVTVDEKTGKYTYKPNPDYHGDDKFTVVVSDGKGGEVTVTVPVTVTPVNDAPNIEDAEVTVKQGVKDPIVHDVNDASTGRDEDVDGDKLTYAITKGNEDGLFVINPNTGIITLADGKMLDHGKAPQHQLEVTATDSSRDQLLSTATITIKVSNDSKITTEITPKGTITGTTDNVEKGPVKLTITGTDKNGNPVTIERTVELDRPDGSSKGQYTYQLTPEDGIVDGSKVTVEAKTVDRQGDTIHADIELPGHSGEETPGLDLVVPTIEITQVATDEKVTWGEEGKEGFEVKGTTTGVEAGQSVAVTFDKTVDGQPVTVEATVGKDGSWTAKITPEQAAKLLEGSVSATVKDIAGNEKSAEAVKYTIDAPTAVVTGYGDNIESVLGNVKTLGKVSESVKLSGKIDPNFAHENSDITLEAATKVGQYGTFTFGDNGQWTYALNSDAKVVDALKASKGPLTEIFTVKDSEGKSYEVKVSINDRVADDGEHVFISATSSLLKDSTNVESDQGTYTIYTNDSLGEITGTASQGVEKVRVYINKQTADTDDEIDSLGYPQYFEVAVKDGKWSLSEQHLTDGLQKTWWADQLRNDNIYLQVRAVDPTTGKVGDVSEKYTFVVDTVAPEATYVNYADGKVTALVSGDPDDAHRAATGNDVIVKYTDKDGNVQVVTGKVGDKAVADKPYLSISVDVKDPSKVDSATDFKVYVKDDAGNIGVNNDSKENPLKIELPTPQVDQYHDNVNNASGTEIIGNTGYSDDPSGLISGTIVLTEEDFKVVDSIRVYLYDNRQNWIEIDKNDLVPESGDIYRWTTKPGDLSKVTTTGKLAEGEVKFYAATYDKESGSLSELSPPFKVTIDVTAPEITIESVAGDQVITQLEKKDGFTVKGSTKGAEEGNTVTILVEGKSYTTTVGKDGKWSIDLPKEATQDLTDGKDYTITASVTDKAGNQSSEANSKAKVNAAPIVTTQTQTVGEDSGTSRFFQVKATDPEDDRINGYSLKYEVLQDTLDPSKGSVTMSESDHGNFKFTPAKDFSGEVTFSVKVTDSYGNSTIAEQKIIVTPVTDKPVATETNLDFDIGQLTLNRYEWSGLTGNKVINGKRYNFNATSGKQTGDGIPKETLEKAIEGLLMDKNYRPTQSSTHSLQASTLTEGHAVYMNGFVYLEAGKTYKYAGKADDAGMIKIGDISEQYVSWQGLNAGSHSSEFTVPKTGFYTFDFYAHNQSGAGNYDFKVTEDNGESVKYYPSTDAIKKELPNFVQLGKFNDPDGNKKGFYELKYGYKGAETEEIQLNKIHAALTDRDGSEILSMKLEGIAEGTQLSYTAVSLDGSTQRHTAIAKNGLIEVKGDKNVLDFTDLVLILPKGVEETLQNVKLTVIATETMTNESVKTEFDFDIEVLSPSRDVHSTSDDDLFSTGSTGNDTLHYGLLSDDDTAGNGTDTWIDFAVGNPQTDDNADVIKFSEDFFSGLISTDLTADNPVNVEKFINVTYDQDTQTATISVDRDGVDDHYQQEELLLLTNQPTEISLEELLNNHQIVIG
ncbi:hypothetical protein BMY_0705 [Wohlfahrtiimonas chitiniclastica]|nr:hypothetical protein BMY_0705 [Wohlfahrtiimonas chitiniclastica]